MAWSAIAESQRRKLSRLVREAGNIAESPQTGFLYEVFHLAELPRLRTQLVVNQHSQAPPVPFEGTRQGLFVAAFCLLQQSESGCWRLHTSQDIGPRAGNIIRELGVE